MTFDQARKIQDFLAFGEFGDVNPSICDSSTYTFLSVEKMEELFEQDLKASDEVTAAKWSQRPILDRVMEFFARLLSPWL